MHARARNGLVDVHQVFALAEAVQEHGHGADVETVRAEPHEVVQDAGDFIEHHPDVLRAQRRLDAEQFLDRHDVGVLVAHHRDVIEPVHVADALAEGLRFCELLRRTMQQAYVRIGFMDDLSLQFQHQAQHTVCRRVLRAEIHRVTLDLSHRPCP